MSHSYPSDISREQFARILPTLESARRRTKPRTVDLYDVFCGVLYLLKSGCQWRMLPADFPNWRTCYKYFRQWSERPGPGQDSILEQVLKKIGWRGPTKQWTERATSFCIVDSQSVKNTDTAGHKGYDAGKKVSGIKRHIGHARIAPCHVTTADLWRCLTGAETASVKCRTCWWTGVTRKALCHCGARPVGSRGGSGETQRTHTFVVPKAMGGGGSFAWLEVPPTLLRKKAQYQPANGGACLHGANPKKIVNRLSGRTEFTLARRKAPT